MPVSALLMRAFFPCPKYIDERLIDEMASVACGGDENLLSSKRLLKLETLSS